eukprot:2313002-Prymnesium_polylepis.1
MLKVCRIEQIFSRRLQDKYLAAVQDEIGLCNQRVSPLTVDGGIKVESFHGIDMNEYLLFHGAPTGLIPRLALQGLDPRNAGTHFGKLFGAGTYLAAHSSKSDIYTKPNDSGERCVLVVRACLGEAHQTTTGMSDVLRPPERRDKRGPLSSVVALTHAQGGTLSQYAIFYQHDEACKCTHCWREVASLNLKVVDDDAEETFYKLKPTTPLQNLMKAHCSRYGLRLTDVEFLVDEVQIAGTQTPADLGLEDGDVLDVRRKSAPSSDQLIKLKVVDDDAEETFYKLKPTTPFEKLMIAHCSRYGLRLTDVEFLFDEVRIAGTQTPADLGLEAGDVIDARLV